MANHRKILIEYIRYLENVDADNILLIQLTSEGVDKFLESRKAVIKLMNQRKKQ